MIEEYFVYIKLFFDSFLSTVILPIHMPWVLATMKHFNLYSNELMLICATTAAVLGSLLNYTTGLIMINITKKQFIQPNKYIYTLIDLLILSCCWLNIIGSFLAFIGGYIKIRPWVIFIEVTLSHLFYFIILII